MPMHNSKLSKESHLFPRGNSHNRSILSWSLCILPTLDVCIGSAIWMHFGVGGSNWIGHCLDYEVKWKLLGFALFWTRLLSGGLTDDSDSISEVSCNGLACPVGWGTGFASEPCQIIELSGNECCSDRRSCNCWHSWQYQIKSQSSVLIQTAPYSQVVA